MIFDASIEKGFFEKSPGFMTQHQKIGFFLLNHLYQYIQNQPFSEDFLGSHALGFGDFFGNSRNCSPRRSSESATAPEVMEPLPRLKKDTSTT